MKIKITQCSDIKKNSIEAWYKDKIGEEFELSHKFANYYWVTYIRDGKKCMNTININDAEKI